MLLSDDAASFIVAGLWQELISCLQGGEFTIEYDSTLHSPVRLAGSAS